MWRGQTESSFEATTDNVYVQVHKHSMKRKKLNACALPLQYSRADTFAISCEDVETHALSILVNSPQKGEVFAEIVSTEDPRIRLTPYPSNILGTRFLYCHTNESFYLRCPEKICETGDFTLTIGIRVEGVEFPTLQILFHQPTKKARLNQPILLTFNRTEKPTSFSAWKAKYHDTAGGTQGQASSKSNETDEQEQDINISMYWGVMIPLDSLCLSFEESNLITFYGLALSPFDIHGDASTNSNPNVELDFVAQLDQELSNSFDSLLNARSGFF